MSWHLKPWVSRSKLESHGQTVSLTIKTWGLEGLWFLYQFSTFNEKNEENLSIRSLNFSKMYHRIPLLLALRLSVQQFQIPLEGLRVVKRLVTFGIIKVTDPLVQNVTNIVCLVDPHHSIFLTITPCSLCFQNQGRFLYALPSIFFSFCTSDWSNPLSGHL